ncbi:MAG: metallopeptidase family protein [Defluviitaleaceae bacterium]|nr:metallopeptidase family protein [Defluviitaleaceae bacterium]
MDNITFEEFGEMLNEIADNLPEDIFVNLNGGINLLPDALPHPEVGMLYILGQYHHGGYLGRYITIYYGSFAALYKKNSRNNVKKQLDKVLRHEFLHHLESMAGEKDLEIQDAIDLARYKRWQK